MTKVDIFLSPEEMDLAAKLKSYQRKISSLRAAGGKLANKGLQAMGTEKSRRQLAGRMRSDAEEYRRDRQVQIMLWCVCSSQTVLLIAVVLLGHRNFIVLLIGGGCGLAASFGCVQRRRKLCVACNVVYFLSSACSMAVTLMLFPVSNGSNIAGMLNVSSGSSTFDNAPVQFASGAGQHEWVAMLECLASVIGAALAAHVMHSPLHLYR